ncbi:hypothetical protein HDU83_002145 [Entophlyctis luteolus]|nr:hypothetical protein HDU83_002145 [Entophlyctis luteolus]
MDSTDAALEALAVWAVESVPSRPPVHVTSSRELRASEPIRAGEVALAIPASRLLSASAAVRDDDLRPILTAVFGNSISQGEAGSSDGDGGGGLLGHWDDHLALCLLLMRERTLNPPNSQHSAAHERSKYAPYARTLPSSFANLLCLPPSALWRLEGTVVSGVVESERQQMELVLNHVLRPAVNSFPGIVCSPNLDDEELWDLLMWAHAAISSRAFSFRIDISTEQSEVFMVPFLDLANHSLTPNLVVSGVDSEKKCLIAKARHDIGRNEILTIAYHDNAPNWFLLSHYGFALDDNPEETVNVSFDDDDSSLLRARRDDLLKIASENLDHNAGITIGRDHEFGPRFWSGQDFAGLRYEDAGISKSMVVSLRILAADTDELSELNEENVSARIIEPLSVDTEIRVFETIELMAETLLGMYPTTLENDLQRLNEDDGGGDERYILIYLIGQKRVLTSVLAWCKANKVTK